MIVRSNLHEPRTVVEAIHHRNLGVHPSLRAEKYRRMRADVFAFYRGTNHLFVTDWQTLQPADPGPSVWICGDLHPKNLGCFRAHDQSVVFDINDFDEAIIAPCSVDLVRCAAGILLAGEIWGHSPIGVMRMVLGYLDGYRAAILAMTRVRHAHPVSIRPTPAAILARKTDTKGPISALIAASGTRTQAELLDRLTRINPSGERTLNRKTGRFLEPDWSDSKAMAQAIQGYGRTRGEADTFQVVDCAIRVAGIGSLGVRRYIALIAGDGLVSGHRLLDIKEGTAPSFTGYAAAAGLDGNDSLAQAHRIVAAQRRLQDKPTIGLDVLEVEGAGYRLRELIPEENRARLDRFREDSAQLRRGLDHVGWITAHAHLRGASIGTENKAEDLARWVSGPATDTVLAAAVRFADRTRGHYKAFRKAKL